MKQKKQNIFQERDKTFIAEDQENWKVRCRVLVRLFEVNEDIFNANFKQYIRAIE